MTTHSFYITHSSAEKLDYDNKTNSDLINTEAIFNMVSFRAVDSTNTVSALRADDDLYGDDEFIFLNAPRILAEYKPEQSLYIKIQGLTNLDLKSVVLSRIDEVLEGQSYETTEKWISINFEEQSMDTDGHHVLKFTNVSVVDANYGTVYDDITQAAVSDTDISNFQKSINTTDPYAH